MRFFEQIWKFLGLAIATLLVMIITANQITANPDVLTDPRLPPLQIHSLPDSLKQWQDHNQEGDYFTEIKPSPLGYLIWSDFPVKIYLDKPVNPDDTSASNQRFLQWVNAVETAIKEWNNYLPLEESFNENEADIIIKRDFPPIKRKINPETGLLEIPRARNGETRYQFYWQKQEDMTNILAHKMTIYLSPNQNPDYTLTTIRHELGHALGIWGHSPITTDVLYFSQSSNIVSISARDINTLIKIYQQPTRLGWLKSIEKGNLSDTRHQ